MDEASIKEQFAVSMAHAIETKSKNPSRAKNSRIIQVSSQEEHERQAKTIAAFVSQMTIEFMNSYKYMSKNAQKEAQLREKAREMEERHQMELRMYEKADAQYEEVLIAEKPNGGKKEIFEPKKSGGRFVLDEKVSQNPNVSVSSCDNGHDLFVAKRTKKHDSKCFHCNDDIKYKEQMITCTGNCNISKCLKCSGCANAHVVHRKKLTEPLSAKNDSCLKCMNNLSNEKIVNWCYDCNKAFCPDQCKT